MISLFNNLWLLKKIKSYPPVPSEHKAVRFRIMEQTARTIGNIMAILICLAILVGLAFAVIAVLNLYMENS